MKNSAAVKGTLAILGMMILILDTKTALRGAAEGVGSCITTVIPSLFPFILLNCWLNDSFAGKAERIPKCITRAAGLSKGTGHILISALLGGYPAGAQAVHRAFSNGAVGKEDAERLLAYTNNAGPAFIFGMTGHLFQSKSAPWLLWGIHVLSASIVRMLTGSSGGSTDTDTSLSGSKADIILVTSKIMCTICAWVTVFKIIVSYLEIWTRPWIPRTVRAVVFGSLELVNGCCLLPEVSDVRMRFVIFSGMLAFGGVCVLMQTVSVARGLRMGYYLMGKLLQTVFSLTISAALVYRKSYLMAVLLIPAVCIFVRSKNKGRIPAPIRV